MEKKLFIFDIGGVVVMHNPPIREFCERYKLDLDLVHRDWMCYLKPMLDGFLDTNYFYKMLEMNYNIDLSNDPVLITCYHPYDNEFMKDMIRRLRESGHRVVSGSNTFAPHWDFLKNLKPSPLDGFDKLYASHEMHLSKPNTAFYQYIADAEGYKNEDCFFIDDSEVNVESARSIGINAFHYTQDNEAVLNYFKSYLSE